MTKDRFHNWKIVQFIDEKRAFVDFTRPELRMMGEKIAKPGLPNEIGTEIAPPSRIEPRPSNNYDLERIEKIVPILKKILQPNRS